MSTALEVFHVSNGWSKAMFSANISEKFLTELTSQPEMSMLKTDGTSCWFTPLRITLCRADKQQELTYKCSLLCRSGESDVSAPFSPSRNGILTRNMPLMSVAMRVSHDETSGLNSIMSGFRSDEKR